MRLLALPLLALLAAAPAIATSDVAEIRLGEAPAPPPSVDRARVSAVERYLAARQNGSAARAGGRAAKLPAMPPKSATAEELYGPQGARLVAFDFKNESLETTAPGRFQATVYLLFADETGQIVESRDEALVFSSGSGAWTCTSRQTTASMSWSSDGVAETARSLGLSEELQHASAHLRAGAAGRKDAFAYSVADVFQGASGRVLVSCLRFTATPGQRGFGVERAPVVLTRDGGSIRVETN
jgi:hypothetical protein